MKQPLIALAVLALLGGCATDGGPYPSLAPRAVEKGSFDEPVHSPTPLVVDPALDTRIAAEAAKLDRIAAGFDAARQLTDRTVARPGAQTVGSDAWLDAQASIARLDDWRTQAVGLATDVEALASARAGRLDPAYPSLDALAARAGAESEREAEALAELQRRVPAP